MNWKQEIIDAVLDFKSSILVVKKLMQNLDLSNQQKRPKLPESIFDAN